MGRGGKILTMLLWSMVLPITSAWAQPDDSGIWGEAIMAQPFDTVPFRAVKIPEWVKETTGCGYTLSVLDSSGRARAAVHGSHDQRDGLRRSVLCLLRQQAPQTTKPRGLARPAGTRHRRVQAAGRAGSWALNRRAGRERVYENHPDWRRIPTRTTEIPQIDLKAYPHGGMLCLLGPYGDFFIEVLAEDLDRLNPPQAKRLQPQWLGGFLP